MSILPNKNRHDDCPVVIIDKLWKNRLHPVPGLYCACHGKLIKWLSDWDAQTLEDMGVENIGMLKVEQKIYDRRIQLLNRNKKLLTTEDLGL
jgi:hypothetical protein